MPLLAGIFECASQWYIYRKRERKWKRESRCRKKKLSKCKWTPIASLRLVPTTPTQQKHSSLSYDSNRYIFPIQSAIAQFRIESRLFFSSCPPIDSGNRSNGSSPQAAKKENFLPPPLLLLFIFIVYYYYYRVGYGLQYRKLFVAHKLLYREYRALPEKVDAAGLPYH